MQPRSITVSGITFQVSPARTQVVEITALFNGSVSRETIDWRAVTMVLATTTGSTVIWASAACRRDR